MLYECNVHSALQLNMTRGTPALTPSLSRTVQALPQTHTKAVASESHEVCLATAGEITGLVVL